MFRIREATKDDNDALLHLEAQSPQGSGISLVIDREDYFYRSRINDDTKVMIGEEDDRLVGVMAYAVKTLYIDGEASRAAYFYDLRGEATYRRSMKRGLLRLWHETLSMIEEDGAAFIYGNVKADNYESLNICSRVGAQIAGSFDIHTLPALRGRVKPLDPHLDRLDDEIERISDAVGMRTLRPVDFGAAYRRGHELGYLHGIYRIEERGSSAQVSAWDLSKIYRGRVLHMPVSLRALGVVLNPLATWLPLPSIPKIDQQITYLQLFDPICEGPRGRALMRRLLQQLRYNMHAAGVPIVTLFVYKDDALADIPRFFPEEKLHYYTMIRPVHRSAVPDEPFYLDIRDI